MVYHKEIPAKAEVLLFVTNIQHQYDVSLISKRLDQQSSILRWTVDLFDRERILKAEVRNFQKGKKIIQKALLSEGYQCSELNH